MILPWIPACDVAAGKPRASGDDPSYPTVKAVVDG